MWQLKTSLVIAWKLQVIEGERARKMSSNWAIGVKRIWSATKKLGKYTCISPQTTSSCLLGTVICTPEIELLEQLAAFQMNLASRYCVRFGFDRM